MILFIFQDNEVVLKKNFILKHSFLESLCRKCYKGEVFFFCNLFFNDDA